MMIIISPAKTLDFSSQKITKKVTHPYFQEEAAELVHVLKKKSWKELGELMKINNQLAELNQERYLKWGLTFGEHNAKQAILAYKGEVYNGLDANSLCEDDLLFAQDRLRIVSGLYGLLKPLDLIQPYRLEMNIKLEVGNTKSLYEFWGKKLNELLKDQLNKQGETLINIASQEYFKAILPRELEHKIITPIFKELRNDEYKVITIYAKKARGLMSRYIIKNRINKLEDIKHFEEDGYFYNDQLSNQYEWVFTR
ncbi:MAG: peroxide stress protein YaaA [Bacteroidota bacterium]